MVDTFCGIGDDSLILHAGWFTIRCYPSEYETTSQRVVVAFTADLDCHYNFPVSNGLWYYLAIRRNLKNVRIMVNGVELEDVVEICELPLAPASDEFRIGSLVCVDEIYGTNLVGPIRNQNLLSELRSNKSISVDIGKPCRDHRSHLSLFLHKLSNQKL